MKKLSTEQKAKAYDEALERARIWKDKSGMPKDRQGILDDIFPELAESDDEKIRKALIEMVHDTTGDSLWVDYDVHKEEALAWLEKQVQKPQGKSALEAASEEKVNNQNCVKPTDKVESKFKVGDKVIGIISGIQYYIIEVCDNHYRTESGCIIMFGAQDNFELVEQQLKKIEQKPTDEEIKELLRTEYEKGRADTLAEMQKSWSDEDEDVLEDVEEAIINYWHGQSQEDLLDWLKSLKDRVQPQQEKEEILKKLEEWLDEYISNLADVGTDTLIGSFRKYLDGKLPVKPKSQWKQSEKLLDVFIKNAIDFFESNFNPLTDGGVIGAFDDKEKMIEEFKEYMKEEGFNEEWI